MQEEKKFIQVGRTAGAYGVKGWVRIVLDRRNGDFIFDVDRWWYLPYPRKAGVSPIVLTPLEIKPHGKDLIARIAEIKTREEALNHKGTLFVIREDLPELQEGDFYDEDLVGLTVKNNEGTLLGTVVGVTDNGAQDLLAVESVEDQSIFYIPMVSAYLLSVDFETNTVTVDWSLDWN